MKTRQARQYRRRTRRGGFNLQKLAYYASLPGIIAGNAAMDYFHAKTREDKMNQRKRIKAEIPAAVKMPIELDFKKSSEPKEKIIVLFEKNFIEPLRHNYQVVTFNDSLTLDPRKIIEESAPSLVIYNLPNKMLPIQPWDGPFIDIHESTLFSYGRKSFPCFILFADSVSDFFKSLQEVEHLGFIFMLSDRKKTPNIINIVADVCLNRMKEVALITRYGKQLLQMVELKVYGLHPSFHPIVFE